MTKRLKKVLLGILFVIAAVGGTLLSSNTSASATTWASTDWGMGRPMSDWYNTNPNIAWSTNGIWMLGGDFHAYLVVAAHTLEHGDNNCRGCQPFSSRFDFQNFPNEKFDLFSVKWSPTAGVDAAIIDFGSIFTGGATPYTDKIFNYCNPSRSDNARCSSNYSGGSGQNAPNVGSWYDNIGGTGPSVGMYVCHSGMGSGTSCGTVQGTLLINQNAQNYHYFGWKVDGLDRCGSAAGDSSGPVFADQGNGQSVVVGLLTAGNLSESGTLGGCYQSSSLHSSSLYMLGIDQIQALFSPWTGGSLVVAT